MDTNRGAGVVVGVVGDLGSREAVRWATTEACRWREPLRLLSAVVRADDSATRSGWYSPQENALLDRVAGEGLRAAETLARDVAPGVEVTTSLVHATPRTALLDAACGARLVVTGARRRGRVQGTALAGLTLGSISLYLAAHAACPTVVVREAPPEGARDVVVGIASPSSSDAAVAFAAAQAEVLGGSLRLVRAWRPRPPAFDGLPVLPGSAVLGDARDRARTRQEEHVRVQAEVEELAGLVRQQFPGLEVLQTVATNVHADELLIGEADRAALLVVGARRHGEFLTSLIGSTTHGVLHGARFPVAVVPQLWRVDDAAPRWSPNRRTHQDGGNNRGADLARGSRTR